MQFIEILLFSCTLTKVVIIITFNDPCFWDSTGLAHLLEHVLFMGCKKYPSENEYDNFLSKHGGSSNASTDYESVSTFAEFDCDGVYSHISYLSLKFYLFLSPAMNGIILYYYVFARFPLTNETQKIRCILYIVLSMPFCYFIVVVLKCFI